jgi:hypothetical protein
MLRGMEEIRRRTRRRALIGAASWLVTPWLPFGAPPTFGSVAHVFLTMPLVSMPFALALLSILSGRRHALARKLEPVAAAMVLAAFLLPQGPAAAMLTAGWVALALTIAITGARGRDPSLVAAHVFLPIGAVWLLLWRLGVAPSSFGPLTALLAALHFHFSGFAFQILVGASDLRARRPIAVVAIVAIPLIAAGTITATPLLKFAGVAGMVLATTTFAALSLPTALRSTVARPLFVISSASLLAAMVLAGVYGVGELTGAGWIGIPRMGVLHGLVNAFGFTLCGLLAHLHRCASACGRAT